MDKATRKIWDLSLDGGADEECGSSTEGAGWAGLMIKTGVRGAQHAVLFEDTQGFKEGRTFRSAAQARSFFKKLCADLEPDRENGLEGSSCRARRRRRGG